MELLIVDDEETALQAVLKNVKWEELPFKRVYTATNITSAKAELENEKIRIVLCDIEMPMGSGYLAQQGRNLPLHCGTYA